MYQDAILRRQKMSRKVYFSSLPSGSLLEPSRRKSIGGNSAKKSNDNNRNKPRSSLLVNKLSPKKQQQTPDPQPQFKMKDIYNSPTKVISITENPGSSNAKGYLAAVVVPLKEPVAGVPSGTHRTRDDVIKAALENGVWEGSEAGESTNPNSPFISSTNQTPTTESQPPPISGTATICYDHSQLYESTLSETPTKVAQSRSTVMTHALTNGIWELSDDDGSTNNSVDSHSPIPPPAPSSSSNTIHVAMDKENAPVLNNIKKMDSLLPSKAEKRQPSTPFVVQEGVLERRLQSNDSKMVWVTENYILLSNSILVRENNDKQKRKEINLRQGNVKVRGVRGINNSKSDKQHIIEIFAADDEDENNNITLACQSADDQVVWVASLIGQTRQGKAWNTNVFKQRIDDKPVTVV